MTQSFIVRVSPGSLTLASAERFKLNHLLSYQLTSGLMHWYGKSFIALVRVRYWVESDNE